MGAHDGEAKVAAALRHIARNERIKAYVLQDSALYNVLLRAARRFIGGETLPECLAVASTLNGRGFATTIDHMGKAPAMRRWPAGDG
jgi:proline dehydrogenase